MLERVDLASFAKHISARVREATNLDENCQDRGTRPGGGGVPAASR